MNQNDSLFHELDDRLSVVKRWGIVRTVQTQSVAEHCFNVQRICIKIAPHFGVVDFEEMFELSQAALHHDDDEAIYGDVPSPAKAYLNIDEKRIDVGATAWYTDASDKTKAIVKLADMLEAYHFLAIEWHMGNFYVRNHRKGLRSAIFDFIQTKLGWPGHISDLCVKWIAAVDTEASKVHP
jgi:5'-deoxynucleotidase YfbR-like HD superfamily hydrolase